MARAFDRQLIHRRQAAQNVMYDPLGSSPFADDTIVTTPPWPTTPHPPNSPIPNLKRASHSQNNPPDKAPLSPSQPTGQFGKEPQIYGQPEAGLISPTANTGANGAKYEKLEPYLRSRITMLDRNRRDILIRFDAQVRAQFLDNCLKDLTL